MVDRVINYVGAVPLDVDLLNTNKNLMIGLGFALQAILGGSTVVDGLACTPTSPASQQVLVAQGSIYSTVNVDGTAFGSLGSDTSHQILKQGLTALGNTAFTCAAPSTSGQSINYLIQGEYQDIDGGSTVLPYYNASNPAVAFNGPANSGTSQNTVRQGKLVLNLKAGASATTGTQVTPTPDAGFTGLWVVSVANGITAITSGMITKYPGAPFINYKLPQLSPVSGGRTLLTGSTTYHVSTTGNDSTGDGSSGNPWATGQHALDYVAANIDIGEQSCVIQLADGTYTSPIVVNKPFVGGIPTLQGNTGTPANCVISTTSADCIYIESGVAVNLGGFTLQTTTGGNGLHIDKKAAVIITGAMNFGACAGDHVQNNDGNLLVSANYTISGNAQNHWNAGINGVIYTASLTVTLTGPPAFSSAFANAHEGGRIYCGSMTFSGSATGTQYLATFGGSVNTNTGGSSQLPPRHDKHGIGKTGYYN